MSEKNNVRGRSVKISFFSYLFASGISVADMRLDVRNIADKEEGMLVKRVENMRTREERTP